MPNYNCEICNYNTTLRTDYKRHLSTKKHNRNTFISHHKSDYVKTTLISEPFQTLNEPFSTLNEPFLTQIEPFLTQKSSISEKKTYFCEFCDKKFGTQSHLTRHKRLNCKSIKEKIAEEDKNKDELEENKKEVEILNNRINKLIDNGLTHNNTYNNTNNTNTNIQNNVNLNIFGKENLSMLTDEVKKELIKGSYKMMPKLLEMIYFNKKFPENHTMKMVNKNKELMKVHKKSGWELVDKVDTIDYLLEDKNYHVDNFYDENSDEFSQFIKRTYKNFRRLFDNRDKDLWKQIKRDVDLLLWNNM